MQFPTLEAGEATREMLTAFFGCNANPRIAEGEFSDMENLTSDGFPLLMPRRRRGLFAQGGEIRGMIAKDSLCWVDGSCFVMNGLRVELGLSSETKQLVSMGAYVVIFPDKKYINTLDLTDFGNLEADFVSSGPVMLEPCTLEGETLQADFVQEEEPPEPKHGQLWLEPGGSSLMRWSGSLGMWVSVAQSYVRIRCPGIGAAFRQYDGVTITGLPEPMAEGNVLWRAEADYLVVPGLLARDQQTAGSIRVRRRVPDMDFVTECGNRLWGCRYGLDEEGRPLNEIYASKLGDFRNWQCYMGLSTDSYTVSLGADGPFTGAVSHLGYPVFFRENCLHKVYGNYPANFRLQTTPCRGVQRGSERSLGIVGEVLYYKSGGGVCAYDGSLPVEVSPQLGQEAYSGACGGGHRGKYYLSMADAGGEYHLFVYDTVRKLWHREDGTRVRAFCSCREELYFLDDAGRIRTVFGTGVQEGPVHWMAQTGDWGVDYPGSKQLVRLTLRLWMETEAQLRVLLQYDSDGVWEEAAVLRRRGLGSAALPLRLRRCDHVRLRLEGIGQVRLYSITKTLEQGAEAV